MRLLLLFTLLYVHAFAQPVPESISDKNINAIVKEAYGLFTQGKYQATRIKLQEAEALIRDSGDGNKGVRGLIAYWQGLTANRQIDHTQAIKYFEDALSLDYRPKDIYYEYGQALFANEKLPQARNAFKESLKRGHKRAVSLYYIGFISQQLRDYKKAVTFYRGIQKLPPEERDDTVQAAEMQIGDIYLTQAEKQPDTIKVVETYVIPQYQAAILVNPESSLATDIKAKIVELQQKYELILFKMRNGRPTLIPPYFLRLYQDITHDSNPVFAATETTNEEAKESSLVSKTEAFGRYTFYYHDIMSISPELRMNYTRHLNRKEEIRKNDNYVLIPAIRTAYEHKIFNDRPGSLLADIDHSYSHRDINGTESLDFNARVTTVSVGERVRGLMGAGDTTVRLRYRIFDSYANTSDSKTRGIGFEHVNPTKSGRVWVFNAGYDFTRVNDESFDTNTLFTRVDVILPATKDWKIIPQFGLGLTFTDPINNDARGNERTLNPSMRFAKMFWKRFRSSVHFDYMQNYSKDEENFAYKKTFYGMDLEYLF